MLVLIDGSCTSWLKYCIRKTTKSSTHSEEKDIKTWKLVFSNFLCLKYYLILVYQWYAWWRNSKNMTYIKEFAIVLVNKVSGTSQNEMAKVAKQFLVTWEFWKLVQF